MEQERLQSSSGTEAQRIGIVGAGAAGLAAARIFSQDPKNEITVFERSNDVGGIWNFSPDVSIKYNVPQNSPANAITVGFDTPASTGGYPTPVYGELRTNLPKDVMEFADAKFPEDVPEFPTHQQVNEYLHRYADTFGLLRFVHLNTEVEALVARFEEQVQAKQLHCFDAMLVCIGRCTHPLIPDTVLVVGFASSGSDCSRMLSYTAKRVYVSMSEPPAASQGLDEPVLDSPAGKFGAKCNPDNMPEARPHIREIDVESNAVVFEDGTSIEIPDVIIYATGYLSLFPFIRSADDLALQPSDVEYSPELTNGIVVHDLYKYTIYSPNPTLAILGLPWRVVPFPMYQYQSLLMARVCAGLALPGQQQMKQEWDSVVSAKPGKKRFDMGLGQVEFQNDILDFVGGSELLSRVRESWVERRKQAPGAT
ncbi:FAD/NAD(P)-binding domain-containing protein [Linderina pennispora]|uniref:FAD/NAD(P)-binding domain-containing protein n=1 Tax=Linderina pennispora TaxID=61395 RepID=A0A1Y1VX83_9FUNG|nr:FAD/NAD(P)-binding domain-containing protein [Linderina pennispora]ORX65892.1 FAD/NAD(P)-binding domain-containing protein [Linderina pennispora]